MLRKFYGYFQFLHGLGAVPQFGQARAQSGDIPTPSVDFVEEFAFSVLTINLQILQQGGIDPDDSLVCVEHYQGLAHRLDDDVRISTSTIRSIARADQFRIEDREFLVPGAQLIDRRHDIQAPAWPFALARRADSRTSSGNVCGFSLGLQTR